MWRLTQQQPGLNRIARVIRGDIERAKREKALGDTGERIKKGVKRLRRVLMEVIRTAPTARSRRQRCYQMIKAQLALRNVGVRTRELQISGERESEYSSE